MSKRILIDEKIVSWKRSYYLVEDDTTDEEIINIIKNEDFENMEFWKSDILDETEELMLVEDNDGQPTLEVYVENTDTLIYTNATKE